jgi:integrase
MEPRRTKSGRYQVKQLKIRGKRYPTKTFDRKEDAQQYIDQLKEAVNKKRYIPSKEIKMFSELADHWFKTLLDVSGDEEGYRPATLSFRKTHIGHLKFSFAQMKVDCFDVQVIQDARQQWLLPKDQGGRGIKKQKTANKIIATLSLIFRYGIATKAGVLEDFTKLLAPPKLSSGRQTKDRKKLTKILLGHIRVVGEKEVLNSVESKQLVLATKPGVFRLIIACLVYCGVRISESLALEFSNVDLVEVWIFVQRTLSTAKVPGIPDQPRYEWFDPKTNAGSRKTPILDDELLKMLREWKEEAKKRESFSENDLVFHQGNLNFRRRSHLIDGEPITNKKPIRLELNRALKQAGIERRITPHLLRHTFGSTLIDMGKPVTEVSLYMGHSSTDVTWRVYTHFIDKRKKSKNTIRQDYANYHEQNSRDDV